MQEPAEAQQRSFYLSRCSMHDSKRAAATSLIGAGRQSLLQHALGRTNYEGCPLFFQNAQGRTGYAGCSSLTSMLKAATST
eukprot:1161186-Pelagomonas_calceolata.AAC.10